VPRACSSKQTAASMHAIMLIVLCRPCGRQTPCQRGIQHTGGYSRRCSKVLPREAAKQCRSDSIDFSCCAKLAQSRCTVPCIMFPRRPCTCRRTGRVSCHIPGYVGLARVWVCGQCAEKCTCFKPTCRLEAQLKGLGSMHPRGFSSTALWKR